MAVAHKYKAWVLKLLGARISAVRWQLFRNGATIEAYLCATCSETHPDPAFVCFVQLHSHWHTHSEHHTSMHALYPTCMLYHDSYHPRAFSILSSSCLFGAVDGLTCVCM